MLGDVFTAAVLLESVLLLETVVGGPIKNEPFTAVVGRVEVGDSGSKGLGAEKPFVESGGGACLAGLDTEEVIF